MALINNAIYYKPYQLFINLINPPYEVASFTL